MFSKTPCFGGEYELVLSLGRGLDFHHGNQCNQEQHEEPDALARFRCDIRYIRCFWHRLQPEFGRSNFAPGEKQALRWRNPAEQKWEGRSQTLNRCLGRRARERAEAARMKTNAERRTPNAQRRIEVEAASFCLAESRSNTSDEDSD